MQTLYLVSHTHWDREWYEPFQVFRTGLVHSIDKLLEIFASDPDYKYFLLDGQTIVLEDYLEVRPERVATLRDLVSEGKLLVGPWYVLPDEFLVSGEAILRNLMRGMRHAREFGDVRTPHEEPGSNRADQEGDKRGDGAMRLGYIPDPFGHISQMPQILRGFGFGAAVFRRGLADEPTEVWWEGADGTRVLACYLRDGYDNAAWLPRDEAGFVEGIGKLRDSLSPHAVTQSILLMNGTDHMEPWAGLPHLLQAARERIDDATIVHASLPMYVDQVKSEITERRINLQVVRGELRNPKRHHLLPGVASARTWIKQRNAHAQSLLEKWVEPFAAFAALESKTPLVTLAWKYLLQNHPHDSICGCGVDQAHKDMQPRFDWVEQIAQPIVKDSLAAVTAAIDTQGLAGAVPLIVFNPEQGPRTDSVRADIEVPGSLEDFVLLNDAGSEVPFQILNEHVEEYYRTEAPGALLNTLLAMAQDGHVLDMAIQDAFVRSDENPISVDVTLTAQGEANLSALKEGLPQIQKLIAQNENQMIDVRAHSPTKFEIEFVARDIPECGYRTFYVAPAKQPRPPAPRHSARVVENEFFRVEPDREDGTLTITDKTTGAVCRGANRIVDGGDRGDLYDYCPPESDKIVAAPGAPPQIALERGAVRQSLRIAMNYRLPIQLSDDRRSRARKHVDESIVTVVSLYPGVRRIDFRVQVDNRARDHRLRVEFPSSIAAAYADADQAFDVVRRSLELPKETQTWVEQPRPEAPLQSFVSISDGRVGLTLATRGLPEYQARREENGVTLVLTLLRCVGWLSRNDLATRTGDAGPRRETPGAQEIGTHVFEYALIPHAGDWRDSFAEAHAFSGPMRAVATSAHAGSLPPSASFLQPSPREFVISAIKLPEEGRGLIVRGYNVGERAIDARIAVWRKFARAARVNLNEEEIAPLELHNGNEVRLRVRAKEIVTVRLAD